MSKQAGKEGTAIGPFWQWLNARERAITAISAVLLMIFTAALVGATVLLYLSGEHSVGVALKAATAAKDSADVAIISQRPWVSVKAAVGQNGLYFNVNGANLDLVLQLNNTGNTPAITVQIIGSPRIDAAGRKTRASPVEIPRRCSASMISQLRTSRVHRQLRR